MFYKCPVYRTPERAGVLSMNFVVALNIPTYDEPNKWTLRGTALLLSQMLLFDFNYLLYLTSTCLF